MTYFILFIVYDVCYVGCDICIGTFIAYFVRNDEIKMFNQSINNTLKLIGIRRGLIIIKPFDCYI